MIADGNLANINWISHTHQNKSFKDLNDIFFLQTILTVAEVSFLLGTIFSGR